MKKFIHFLKKHKCCAVIVSILFYFNWDTLLAEIATPIRCKMWEGREFETFLTPEEWRKISGVEESLKKTKWVNYSEEDLFFIKSKEKYNPSMYIDNNEYDLFIVNNKYPNLNIYIYIYTKNYLGHNVAMLYDQKLNVIIARYNNIVGYSRSKLFGVVGQKNCNNKEFSDSFDFLMNYLN